MKSRVSVHHRISSCALRVAIQAAEGVRRTWPVAVLCLALLAAAAVWRPSAASATSWAWKSWERLFGRPAPGATSDLAAQAQPNAGGASGLNLTVFDDPSAGTGTLQGTVGTVINASGEVAGIVSSATGVARGFVRATDGSITDFSASGAGSSPPPGSAQGTIPTAIDTAGDVVGVFVDASNAYHGFLRASDGTITEFDAPGASPSPNRGTSPLGMNDSGLIVGFYTTGDLTTASTYHGFLRTANGVIVTLDEPNAGTGESPIGRKQGTSAAAISASGEIAGTYIDSNNVRHGFVRSTGGAYTSFDPPGSTSSGGSGGGMSGTQVLGIDTAGDVVGAFTDVNLVRHGYVRAANGAITEFDVPGANTTAASGSLGGTFPIAIDPGGNYIVGLYEDSNFLNHGFAFSQPLSGSGTFTSITAPNAATTATLPVSGTAAGGVNVSGEVVGGYIDSNNVGHGYVLTLTPPTVTATPTFTPPAGTYSSTQTVTISDATPGATIYYTTDGTTPTTNSTVYSSAITVASSETIEAFATASGYTDSAVAIAVYNINGTPVAATPTFSPPAGTYASTQMVTISDTTPGAKIYYTTTGANPTTSSTLYSGPITVSSSETIKAIATATGYVQSAVATAAYIINGVLVAATPTFSPPSGNYAAPVTLTISDATPGAKIYFTNNGSTPTTSSTQYLGPFTVNMSGTIKAIATANGYTQSAVATAVYTIGGPTAQPTFAPRGGTWVSGLTVNIADNTPGAIIYYTTNGTIPTTSSAVYSGPLTVSTPVTVEAFATAVGYTPSAVAGVMYANAPQAGQSTTTYTYKGNNYGTTSGQTCGGNYCTGGPYALNVVFTTTLTGSALDNLPLTDITSTVTSYKLTDGSGLVDDSSSRFGGNFQIATDASGNIVSWLVESCHNTCNIQMQTNWHTYYSFQPGADFSETAPGFTGAYGFVSGNPGTWTHAVGQPVQIASTPTFSPAPGTYASAQSVTIADTLPGATIHYTTGGSAPGASSPVYTGPIPVSSSETINAVAMAYGYMPSPVAAGAYVIGAPFAIAPATGSPASATVSPGGAATYTLTLSPSGASTFPAAVTFSASGLPSGATATFSPNPVPAGSGTTAVTLSIQTSSASAQLHSNASAWPLALGILILPLAGMRRARSMGGGALLMWVVLLCALMGAMTACGGGGGGGNGGGGGGGSPQTYTITITATSGQAQQTTTVTLKVQ